MLQMTSTFVAVSMSLTVAIAKADISSELTISVVCCDVTGFSVLSDLGALGVLGVLSVLVCLGALLLLGALLGFFALWDKTGFRIDRLRSYNIGSCS